MNRSFGNRYTHVANKIAIDESSCVWSYGYSPPPQKKKKKHLQSSCNKKNHSKIVQVVVYWGERKHNPPKDPEKKIFPAIKKKIQKCQSPKVGSKKNQEKTRRNFLLFFPFFPPFLFPIPHDINDILGERWFGSGGKFGGGHPMESTDPQLSFWEANWWWGLEVPKGRSKGPKGAWRIGIFW